MTRPRSARAAAAILALCLGPPVLAQCRALEYAELDAMRAEQLLRMRCDYRQSVSAWMDIATKTAKTSIYAAQSDMAHANRCAQEVERLDRLLARKMAIQGDERQVALELNATCAQRQR